MKPREIEIDSASVIRGSPEHRVPCVTSKVHGPRSSDPSCLPSPFACEHACTSIQRTDRCTSCRNSFLPPPDPSSRGHSYNYTTGSFVSPASPDFPSSRFLPLRRDRKIRTMGRMQMRACLKESSRFSRVRGEAGPLSGEPLTSKSWIYGRFLRRFNFNACEQWPPTPAIIFIRRSTRISNRV